MAPRFSDRDDGQQNAGTGAGVDLEGRGVGVEGGLEGFQVTLPPSAVVRVYAPLFSYFDLIRFVFSTRLLTALTFCRFS